MKQQCISPKKPAQCINAILDNVKFQGTHQVTIAQFNKVSLKDNKQFYNIESPFRILLPQYFNIPIFKDFPLPFATHKENKTIPTVIAQDAVFRKRMKDLSLLAQGMKRAKNIREESRYYFTQGVLLHNQGQFLRSIQYFDKFLKIVLCLKDSKSIELALNSIACAQMYLGQYSKAIELHKKQVQVSERTDHFLSMVNIAMCFQLMGNTKQAYSRYQQASQLNENDQRRKKALEELIDRMEKKIQNQEIFLTENNKQKNHSKQLRNNLIKSESQIIMKKIVGGRQYEEAKFKFAISSAEQGIENYLAESFQYKTPT